MCHLLGRSLVKINPLNETWNREANIKFILRFRNVYHLQWGKSWLFLMSRQLWNAESHVFSFFFFIGRRSNYFALHVFSSLLYIETADRPGLLLEIIKVITDVNLDVESAEVDTEVCLLLISLSKTRIFRKHFCHY